MFSYLVSLPSAKFSVDISRFLQDNLVPCICTINSMLLGTIGTGLLKLKFRWHCPSIHPLKYYCENDCIFLSARYFCGCMFPNEPKEPWTFCIGSYSYIALQLICILFKLFKTVKLFLFRCISFDFQARFDLVTFITNISH